MQGRAIMPGRNAAFSSTGRRGATRRGAVVGILAAVALCLVSSPPARAQGDISGIAEAIKRPPVPLPKPSPDEEAALPPGFSPEPEVPDSATPYAPAVDADTGTPADENEGTVYLVSRLVKDGDPLDRGMMWRVYSDKRDTEGKLTLVANATGGDAEFRLDPGTYLVHAGFGYAGSTTRIKVEPGRVNTRTIVLDAGGLKLDAELAENRPLDADEVKFDVYANETRGETGAAGARRLVASKAGIGTMLRLNAGSYYVVSKYGSVNAVVRADIKVQPGKLTEATVYHKAARITLKLVNEPGGEALANTEWSLLTPGGDQLAESVGAFPSFILAEGDYAVVAKNHDQIFNREFSVESGIDREVEVLAMKRN